MQHLEPFISLPLLDLANRFLVAKRVMNELIFNGQTLEAPHQSCVTIVCLHLLCGLTVTDAVSWTKKMKT